MPRHPSWTRKFIIRLSRPNLTLQENQPLRINFDSNSFHDSKLKFNIRGISNMYAKK